MSNIFKAMMYRIAKSRIFVYTIICSLGFPLMFSLMGIFSDNKEQGVYGTWDNFFFIGNLIFLVFVCAYNCSDYRNKTINLEIMNGHSPGEIFAGRGLALIATAEIMFNIGFVITHLVLKNNNEYSSIIDSNDLYVLRIIAIELIFLAYVVFYVFASFVARNTIIALIISWIGFGVSGLVVLLDDKIYMPEINKLSSIIGPNAVKNLILGDFTAVQGVVSIVISLCLIVAFVIIGIKQLSKQEF